MGRPQSEAWVTVELTWQRALAAACFMLALVILGFAFVVRPAVSGYVGRQVSQQIGEEVADELARAVTDGLLAPPAPSAGQPGAGPSGAQAGAQAGAQTGAQAGAQAQPGAPGQLSVQTGGAPPAGPAISASGQTAPGAAQAPGQAVVGAITDQLRPPAQQGGGEQGGGEQAQAPMPGGEIGAPEASSHASAVVPPTTTIATPISAPQSERSLEQIVEQLPPGEITVTEAKLNARIGPRVAAMAPIEGAEVRFVPGAVQVTLKVFGQANLATAGLGVSAGGVVVQDPRIVGPLGMLVEPDALVRPIEEELNSILELAGREVRAVRIEQGQIVVTIN